MLWERETRSRDTVLHILACEADQLMYQRETVTRIFEKKGWGSKIEGLRKKMKNHYAEVRDDYPCLLPACGLWPVACGLWPVACGLWQCR
jgi:hypothetical protein